MDVRYLTDEKGERIGVLLGIEEYERLMEELEELNDIQAYKETKAALESGEDELIPYEQARKEMEKNRARSR